MAAVQLNFTLRTSAKCKTVHLVGSWDNYAGQLPLSKDATKVGGWKGTFRFQGTTLQQGQRYWYYYIIDGYHVSHDPARESTVEPTTGRKLNILDIPYAQAPPPAASQAALSRHSRAPTNMGPLVKGRALSPSQIQSPLPSKPYATRGVATEKFDPRDLEALARQYARHGISASSSSSSSRSGSADYYGSGSDSDLYSPVPSLSSRSSNSTSPSSMSSGSFCTCERYGITREGARVKMDCGGRYCGYSGSSSDCSSESEDEKRYRSQQTRRQGVVVRR